MNRMLIKDYFFKCDILSTGCLKKEVITLLEDNPSWKKAIKEAENKGWIINDKRNVCPKCQEVLK